MIQVPPLSEKQDGISNWRSQRITLTGHKDELVPWGGGTCKFGMFEKKETVVEKYFGKRQYPLTQDPMRDPVGNPKPSGKTHPCVKT